MSVLLKARLDEVVSLQNFIFSAFYSKNLPKEVVQIKSRLEWRKQELEELIKGGM